MPHNRDQSAMQRVNALQRANVVIIGARRPTGHPCLHTISFSVLRFAPYSLACDSSKLFPGEYQKSWLLVYVL